MIVLGCAGPDSRSLVPIKGIFLREETPSCDRIAAATDGRPLQAHGSGAVFVHDSTLEAFGLRDLGPTPPSCTPARYIKVTDRSMVGVELLGLLPGDYEIHDLVFRNGEETETTSKGDLPLRFSVSRGQVTVLGDVGCIRATPTDDCLATVAALGRGHDLTVQTIEQRAAGSDASSKLFATWARAIGATQQ